jgi:hypothetical protein
MISKRVLIISASIITIGIVFAISLISDKGEELNEQSKDYKIIYSNVSPFTPFAAIAAPSNSVNDDSNANDLNVNVTVNIEVTIDNKLKGVNPNIFKAARTALFNFENEIASYNNIINYLLISTSFSMRLLIMGINIGK